MFGTVVKWVAEIDDTARLPEYIDRAWRMALSGRPGPVVLSLPEDMLSRLPMPEPEELTPEDQGPAPPAAPKVDFWIAEWAHLPSSFPTEVPALLKLLGMVAREGYRRSRHATARGPHAPDPSGPNAGSAAPADARPHQRQEHLVLRR
mgnify:CR=1 FL=1